MLRTIISKYTPIFITLFLFLVTMFAAFLFDESRDEVLEVINPERNVNEYYQLITDIKIIGVVNRYAGKIDFDGDGYLDLIAGGEGGDKQDIHILKNNGDGTLTEITDSVVTNSIPKMYMPIGEVADYNGDGYDDIFIADGGSGEGAYNENNSGGFLGGEPSLILSNADGTWTHSEIITDEIWDIKNDPRLDANEATGRTLHAKGLTSGDIDNDGDIDIQVESGGGADVLDPFFLVNQTVETGELDFVLINHLLNPEIIEHETVWGYPRYESTWRFGANELYDINNDGYADWIKAQLRATPPSQQSSNFHQIVMNDAGIWKQENILPLERPNWEDGYSYSRAITVGDLNQDNLPDILISQDRNNKNEGCCTGRYIQALINKGSVDNEPQFEDQTSILLPDQSLTTPEFINGIDNGNNTHYMEITDFNGDGLNDILMLSTLWHATNENAPLVYMNTGTEFINVPTEIFTFDREDFGLNPYSLELNGDNLPDFIFSQNDGESTTFYTVISISPYLP